MNRAIIFILVSSCLFFFSEKVVQSQVPIIPQPESVESGTGRFTIKAGIPVFLPEEYQKDLGPYIQEKIRNDTGIDVVVSSWEKQAPKHYIGFEKANIPEVGREGYMLEITPHHILGKANTYAGLFYAFQTLRQLISSGAWQFPGEKVSVACMTIKDRPRFEWRGVMLDVARHFQPKEYILKQIDLFSSYKINKLHLHLTDDQGWRIEIKKYPNLTKKGAWRADRKGISWWSRDLAKLGEPAPVGGFYSQDDIRKMIAFARVRNVEIIPEIDMPGHSKALTASYPFLSCRNNILFEVSTGGKAPDNTVCPGKETTYQFIDSIISEVARLFPSKYIHIGGDECNKSDWMQCPDCNKRMKQDHLANYDELQSYFITRIDSQVRKCGKTLIGWDEIMEGKGVPGAIIMAWRRNKYSPEVDAPRSGYKTIQASYKDSYISQIQGPAMFEPEGPKNILTLHQVYSYEPVPAALSPAESTLIIGSEVCLWGEFTPTPEHCEYMLYPRTLADAEVGWTQPSLKDWTRFEHAVEDNFSRLDRDHVHYSISTYNPQIKYTVDTILNKADVQIIPDSDIHELCYTTDGTDPTAWSETYHGRFSIQLHGEVKAAIFNSKGELLGKVVSQKVEVVHKKVKSKK